MNKVFLAASSNPTGQFTEGISAYPVTIEELGELGNLYLNITIFLLIIIAIYCLYKLWTKEIKLKQKVCWTIVLLIPLFGILIYGYSFSDSSESSRKV